MEVKNGRCQWEDYWVRREEEVEKEREVAVQKKSPWVVLEEYHPNPTPPPTPLHDNNMWEPDNACCSTLKSTVVVMDAGVEEVLQRRNENVGSPR